MSVVKAITHMRPLQPSSSQASAPTTMRRSVAGDGAGRADGGRETDTRGIARRSMGRDAIRLSMRLNDCAGPPPPDSSGANEKRIGDDEER